MTPSHHFRGTQKIAECRGFSFNMSLRCAWVKRGSSQRWVESLPDGGLNPCFPKNIDSCHNCSKAGTHRPKSANACELTRCKFKSRGNCFFFLHPGIQGCFIKTSQSVLAILSGLQGNAQPEVWRRSRQRVQGFKGCKVYILRCQKLFMSEALWFIRFISSEHFVYFRSIWSDELQLRRCDKICWKMDLVGEVHLASFTGFEDAEPKSWRVSWSLKFAPLLNSGCFSPSEIHIFENNQLNSWIDWFGTMPYNPRISDKMATWTWRVGTYFFYSKLKPKLHSPKMVDFNAAKATGFWCHWSAAPIGPGCTCHMLDERWMMMAKHTQNLDGYISSGYGWILVVVIPTAFSTMVGPQCHGHITKWLRLLRWLMATI